MMDSTLFKSIRYSLMYNKNNKGPKVEAFGTIFGKKHHPRCFTGLRITL